MPGRRSDWNPEGEAEGVRQEPPLLPPAVDGPLIADAPPVDLNGEDWWEQTLGLLDRVGNEVEAWRQLCQRVARAARRERRLLRRAVSDLQDLLSTQQEENRELREAASLATAAYRLVEGRLSGESRRAFLNAARIGHVLTGDVRLRELNFEEYEEGDYNHLLLQGSAPREMPGFVSASSDETEDGAPSDVVPIVTRGTEQP